MSRSSSPSARHRPSDLRAAREGKTGEVLENEERSLDRGPHTIGTGAKRSRAAPAGRAAGFSGIPRSLQTEGLRPLGRLALVDNIEDILTCLRETLTVFTNREARITTRKATGLDVREETPAFA